MSFHPDEFFDNPEAHPWSKIKDRILGSYIVPYLTKIVRKGKPILLIDAFAGPGRTIAGQPGSPLILCKAADERARGNYRAIFINKEEKHHNILSLTLKEEGYSNTTTPVLGDGPSILKVVAPNLRDQSVFVYIDPFGLTCEFDVVDLFLQRRKEYSTELLIILHMPILHRLAAREALSSGQATFDSVKGGHDKLTRTLGGEYWKKALLSEGLDTKQREEMIVREYQEKLRATAYLQYTGACPVQQSRESVTKYYMIFASPHPDAMLLFNDEMCKVFNQHVHEEEVRDTLFSGQHWTEWRDPRKLKNLVLEYVERFPGSTRDEIWFEIVKDNFMVFWSSEYIKAVKQMVDSGEVVCSTPVGSPERKTKKLNGQCALEPPLPKLF